MRSEVTYSGPKACMRCGDIIRINYVDGEFYRHVELEPKHPATKKNPNPIYATHKCEPDNETHEAD